MIKTGLALVNISYFWNRMRNKCSSIYNTYKMSILIVIITDIFFFVFILSVISSRLEKGQRILCFLVSNNSSEVTVL